VRGLLQNIKSEANVLEERDSDSEMESAIMHADRQRTPACWDMDRGRDRDRRRGAATAWRLWFEKTR